MEYIIQAIPIFRWILLVFLGIPWLVFRFGWFFTSTDPFWVFLGKQSGKVWFMHAFLFDAIIKGTLVFIALQKLFSL